MSILNKFLNKYKVKFVPTSPEVAEEPSVNVSQHLFQDMEPPVSELASNETNRLREFLEKDYAGQGYSDGYKFHSGDILNNVSRALMSEFRNLTDEQAEKIRARIQELKENRIDSEGLSGRMVRKIDLAIEDLNKKVEQLEKEKENSSVEEGLVMRVVNNYREGFIRGMEEYQTQKLFAGNSGLFD